MYDEKDHQKWIKNETTLYAIRFMNSTGVPDAIRRATHALKETQAEYIKGAVVSRLKDDGFLEGDIILNMNKKRHKDKLERLEAYVISEKEKLKK